MLDGTVGYVVLRRMSQGSAEELRAAVDTLVAQGMTSLVLDLRSNPGGLIREGVAVAGLFLEAGDTVATSVGRSPEAPQGVSRRGARGTGITSAWPCSSTAARPARPSSWRARCRTTTAR